MKSLRVAVVGILFGAAPLIFGDRAHAQIVALGASTVQGYGVSPSESFPAQLESMLRARGSNTRVINAGVYGESSGFTLARVGSAVPPGTKTVILAIFPLNDTRKGLTTDVTKANTAAIRQQLSARGIKVIDAAGIVRSISAQPGMLQPDRIHPTAEAYRRIAATLLHYVN
jgi:acyl-CoA thioesterase-1